MSNRDRYLDLKEKLTSKYNTGVQVLNKILNTMDKYGEVNDSDSLHTKIFKKYLEFESVCKVAKFINDQGYRIKTDSYIGQRQYIGCDITEILESDDVEVDEELKNVVQYLQVKNYNEMLKRWG